MALTKVSETVLDVPAKDLTSDEVAGIQAATTPINAGNQATSEADAIAIADASSAAAVATALRTSAFLHTEDQKASAAHGGAFNNGAFQTRDQNTVVTNNISGASLNVGTGEITLPAGTYLWEGYAVANDVDAHIIQLYDTTATAMIKLGVTGHASTDQNTPSIGTGVFTIGVESVLEMQHQCTTSIASTGFGRGHAFAGVSNVFSYNKFWKQ